MAANRGECGRVFGERKQKSFACASPERPVGKVTLGSHLSPHMGRGITLPEELVLQYRLASEVPYITSLTVKVSITLRNINTS
jgi:hypothetical protein